MMIFQETDAPLLFVFGQSNAHGHGTRLPEAEKILKPLTNVFGLSCEYNQSYGLNNVVWSGFVTEGMNLGETQDHTYCLAESFARIWQKRTNAGEKLPPLYIVQISIGAMGIAEKERDGLNMWWRGRRPVMEPGTGDCVNISLYPLAQQIISLAIQNLRASGKNPLILGLHWNQWETEADTGGASVLEAEDNYRELFNGFRNAAQIPCPIWLYKPLSDVYCNPAGVKALTELFEKFVYSGEDYHMIDLTQSSYWKPGRADKGIFQEDLVHYSPEVHRYFAELMEEEIFGNRSETILVLGDSISNDGRYVSFINTYLRLYMPEAKIVFRNFGVSSETLSGLSEPDHPFPRPCLMGRLEKILETVRPDRVVACYGINDGIYYPFSQERFEAFKSGWEKLTEAVSKCGARLTAVTPPPFDAASFLRGGGTLLAPGAEKYSYMEPYEKYDEVMERYARIVTEEPGCDVADIYSALRQDYDCRNQDENHLPQGDGIHPDLYGHLLMARILLKTLFGYSTEQFSKVMEADGFRLFEKVYERDTLYHCFDIESVGHDNIFKAEYLEGDELEKAAARKEKEIVSYIAAHEELLLQKGEWNGFRAEHFHFEGYEAVIVFPEHPKGNKPWIWRTEFFGAFAQADVEMLKKGCHLLHLSIPDQFGCPAATEVMERFQDYAEKRYALSKKAVLFGFSRGGLYALHYAARCPERIAALYLDAPVVDIASWPKGSGKGEGSAADWKLCRRLFGLKGDDCAPYQERMREAIRTVTAHQIPLMLVAGDRDTVVPYEENGVLLEAAFRAGNVPMSVVIKPDAGHHPHSLENAAPIAEFLERYL